MDFLQNSLIVAAHPDDEILWFAGVVADVDRIVTVYEDYWPKPEIGNARRRALANFPRSIESLGVPESASNGCAPWDSPMLNEFGIRFGNRTLKRNAKQRLMHATGRAPWPTREAGYSETFAMVRERLREIVEPDMNVFTHNPWGEYGHEDHVQVFRVLDGLRDEVGFRLWMTNHCTERALPLALTYFGHEPAKGVRREPNLPFVKAAVAAYKQAGCWTWDENWRWFSNEVYCEAPRGQKRGDGQQHFVPLNMFRIGSA